MASRKGAGAFRRMLPRGDIRPDAASLSLHRQRSRRRHTGQAADERRHHRPSDATFDAGGVLRTAQGPGGAGRRILRGRGRRSAAAEAAQPADPRSRPRHRPRPRRRDREGRQREPGARKTRRLSLRPQGNADPRRLACFRPGAGRSALDRSYGRARPCAAGSG